MPDFFAKYHDADSGGFLIRACAEGSAVDFQKAGGGLVKMDLDFKDLIFAADGPSRPLHFADELHRKAARRRRRSL